MTDVSSQEAESQMHGWHMCSSTKLKKYFWLTMQGELIIIYHEEKLFNDIKLLTTQRPKL